jgi:hypothetical protein
VKVFSVVTSDKQQRVTPVLMNYSFNPGFIAKFSLKLLKFPICQKGIPGKPYEGI